MDHAVTVERISTPEGFEEFARLPFRVYAGHDAWWPPDIHNEIDLLAGRARIAPYIDLEPFCARREGLVVARVNAIVNHRYNRHWNEPLGLLTHFEAMPGEDEAVGAMLEEALGALLRCGMNGARSGFAAFLDYPYAIDNYGELPSFLMRGNPDCYHRYFKNAGFETEKGHVDYTAPLTRAALERYRERIAEARSRGARLVSWGEYGFNKAVGAWTEVTNRAFMRHWGWNPVTVEEVAPMLMPLEGTAVADLSVLALLDARVVGTVFSVPDLSGALARVRPGARVDPERGGGTRGALINIGVIEEARGRRFGIAMAARSFLAMAARGMRYAGYTLVLDDNWASRKTAEALGARVTANFVTYRKKL